MLGWFRNGWVRLNPFAKSFPKLLEFFFYHDSFWSYPNKHICSKFYSFFDALGISGVKTLIVFLVRASILTIFGRNFELEGKYGSVWSKIWTIFGYFRGLKCSNCKNKVTFTIKIFWGSERKVTFALPFDHSNPLKQSKICSQNFGQKSPKKD